jgi:hypothetical protein
MCNEQRRKEVMPVFSRPYLRKNSTGHCRAPIFGVCDDEALGICFAFFKPQMLMDSQKVHQQAESE